MLLPKQTEVSSRAQLCPGLAEAAHLYHHLFIISGNHELKASTRPGAHFSSGFLYSHLILLSLSHSSLTRAVFRSQRLMQLCRQLWFPDQWCPSSAPTPSICPGRLSWIRSVALQPQPFATCANSSCIFSSFLLLVFQSCSYHSTANPRSFGNVPRLKGKKNKNRKKKKFLNFAAFQYKS